MKRPYPELQRERRRGSRRSSARRRSSSSGTSRTACGCSTTRSARPRRPARTRSRATDAFELHSTYGIPVEVTESLAADQNLRRRHGRASRRRARSSRRSRAARPRPRPSSRPARSTRSRSRTTTAASSSATRRPRPRRRVIGILAQDQPGRLGDGRPRRPADRPGPRPHARSTARAGGQVGDIGEIRGEGFVFQRRRHEEGQRLHAPRRPGRRGDRHRRRPGRRRRSTPPAARRSAGRTRRRTSCTTPCTSTWASTPSRPGSKVEPDRLRFDFANPEAVGTRAAPRRSRRRSTRGSCRAEPVTWTTMPIAEARALGAMALFGEKYPDIVRVVQMGDFSRELCGGTHLDNVGQVGLFKIVGEESVSAGTRRITALTGQAALDYVRQEEEPLAEVAAALEGPPAPGRRAGRWPSWRRSRPSRSRPASAGPRRRRRPRPTTCSPTRPPIGEVRVVTRALEGASPDELRQLIDVLRRKAGADLAVLLAIGGRRQGPARRRPDPRPDRAGPARRPVAQGGRPDRRRRRRRPSRPRPGRRQEPRADPGRTRTAPWSSSRRSSRA